MLVALVLGLPVFAAVGPTKLENASVTPRTGTTATLVAFQVTYRNVKGLPPDYVRVRVGATTTYPMSSTTTDWKGGVVFTVSTRLSEGVQDVTFEARDAEKFPDVLAAGTVDIGADPASPPTPAPAATTAPAQAPAPTPRPTEPAATSAPAAIAPLVPEPTDQPGGGASPDGSPSSSTVATSGAAGTDEGGGPGRRNDAGGPALDAGGATGAVGGGAAGDPTAGAAGGSSTSLTGSVLGPRSDGGSRARVELIALAAAATRTAADALFDANGSYRASSAWLAGPLGAGVTSLGWDLHRPSFVVGLLGSAGAVTVWMAFALFGKRRRDETLPAPPAVLAASAGQVVAAIAVAPVAEPLDPEALMPRWRRPSLLEARRTDPARAPARVYQAMSFSSSAVGSGRERRLIRYAVAALLDRPDELEGIRLGDLSTGDEVELIERSGSYWLVGCPDGRQGWLHRMTLGDVVTGRPFEIAADESADGQDALRALLAARGLG